MKSSLLALLLLLASACAAAAQTPAPPADAYALGDRKVFIPPPAGFVEATSRSEKIKKFFAATESPELDLLAVHLPAADMERMARGEVFDLGFYTKVSVSKRLRAADSPREYFAQLVAHLRANSPKVLDFKRPEMQSQLKHMNKGLSEMLKENAEIDLSQPVNLGEIQNTARSFGLLLLLQVKFAAGGAQTEKMLVAGTSAVWVRDRIVWVYTYRAFNSDKDADDLRAFTRRWLAEIVSANP
jgi:hypothetical protein